MKEELNSADDIVRYSTVIPSRTSVCAALDNIRFDGRLRLNCYTMTSELSTIIAHTSYAVY